MNFLFIFARDKKEGRKEKGGMDGEGRKGDFPHVESPTK